jgi:hypothetical protein
VVDDAIYDQKQRIKQLDVIESFRTASITHNPSDDFASRSQLPRYPLPRRDVLPVEVGAAGVKSEEKRRRRGCRSPVAVWPDRLCYGSSVAK